MKKILLVANSGFGKTGVPTVFMNIVRTLSSKGYSFDIIYFDDKNAFFKDEFLSYGGKAFLFKSRFSKRVSRYLSGFSYYRKTQKIIKHNGPYDAVHCFKEYMNCYFMKAAFKSNVAVRIFHNNNSLSINGNLINRLLTKTEKKSCLRYMTKLVGCSANSCITCFGRDYPFTVLNNAYDDEHFFYSNSGAPKKLSLVQVGTFNERKNQLFTLKVLNEIKLFYPEIHLHLIGADPTKYYLNLMEKFIQEYDLGNNVTFHDFDCDQRKVYELASFSILSSRDEPFGIVLIEAQACGLKCFVSDVVPKSANVGGCILLPLSLGEKEWAKTILREFKDNGGKREEYDCSHFKNSFLIKEYLNIYGKE